MNDAYYCSFSWYVCHRCHLFHSFDIKLMIGELKLLMRVIANKITLEWHCTELAVRRHRPCEREKMRYRFRLCDQVRHMLTRGLHILWKILIFFANNRIFSVLLASLLRPDAYFNIFSFSLVLILISLLRGRVFLSVWIFPAPIVSSVAYSHLSTSAPTVIDFIAFKSVQINSFYSDIEAFLYLHTRLRHPNAYMPCHSIYFIIKKKWRLSFIHINGKQVST